MPTAARPTNSQLRAGRQSGSKPKLDHPRQPQRTLLYQTTVEHFETWLGLASRVGQSARINGGSSSISLGSFPCCGTIQQFNTSSLRMKDTQRGAQGTLIGHVAWANPVWQGMQAPCVAVFNGPQSYVSPSFYLSKARDGKDVPTWNYAVAHVHGHAPAVHEPAAVLDIITCLSNHFEQPFERPWQVPDAPALYIERMLGAIVGIEIAVTHWVAKFKTKQHQSAENRAGVAAGLQAQTDMPPEQAMAQLVRRLPLQNA